MMAEPPEVMKIEVVEGELSVLSLKPGDRLVLHTDAHLSDSMRGHLQQTMGRIAPGHECVVIEGGARLGVLRSEEGG